MADEELKGYRDPTVPLTLLVPTNAAIFNYDEQCSSPFFVKI